MSYYLRKEGVYGKIFRVDIEEGISLPVMFAGEFGAA